MRRCLILANQTLSSETLVRAVQERVDQPGDVEPCAFYIVAPATPTRDMQDTSGGKGPSTADRAYALAQQRLSRALDRLEEIGVKADGEVGDPDPVQAVQDALERVSADEVVVSTLPTAVSAWLRRDVPARLRRACTVPVIHVVAEG